MTHTTKTKRLQILTLELVLLAAAGILLAPQAAMAAGARQSASPPLKLASLKVAAPAQVAAYTPPAQPAAIEPAAPAPVASADNRLESLGTGDMVRITVFRNPDLTTETKVTERGTILFPMIGEVPVAGLTPAQVGGAIAEKLKAGRYVVNPEVTVSIAQVNSRQVSVLGNVAKPGRYPLDSVNVKLTDVLATAGGIAAPGSDMVTVVSVKDGKSSKVDVDLAAMFRNGDLSRNIDLAPGDTIYVHRAPMVYVYGEVQKGGSYRLEPNMTVMQAIAMGGGINTRGTERGIKINRRGEKGDVNRIDARLTDTLQPDDVIYVRESWF
jgi:polysaccharide export outer membrane protein